MADYSNRFDRFRYNQSRKNRKSSALSIVATIFLLIIVVLFTITLIFKLSRNRVNYLSEDFDFQDQFEDLMEIVLGENKDSTVYDKIIIAHEDDSLNPTLAEIMQENISETATNFERFHLSISKRQMYEENDENVDRLLKDMNELPIIFTELSYIGSQFSLSFEHSNNMKTLMKANRLPIDHQVALNRFYFDDFERANAEVAAFHVDRLLGFRRALPVVGRILNMTADIFEPANEDLMGRFFISPPPFSNVCFNGYCDRYCNVSFPICGKPETIEASLAALLPTFELGQRIEWNHPWRRSTDFRSRAEWEFDENYCEKVRNAHPYNTGSRLLDLMDMAILDFLIGNMYRPEYETFRVFGNDSFTIHLNQALGFGQPFHDEISILAPVTQCCLIQSATLTTLLKFHTGPTKLSEALRNSLEKDKLSPVLWEPHFEAIDRRVEIVLKTVRKCLQHSKP